MINFDATFFEKYQKILLWVANHRISRWILGLNRIAPGLKQRTKHLRIAKIDPASVHWYIGRKGKKHQYVIASYTRPRFAEALAYNLSPFAFLMYQPKRMSWRFSPVGAMGMIMLAVLTKGSAIAFMGTTTSYYASSGDGDAKYEHASGLTQAGWDAIHDATTAQAVEYNQTASNNYYSPGRWSNSSTVQIMRAFFPIDTSGLGAGATISSATFYVYVTDHYSASVPGGAPMGFSLLQSQQASATVLATTDFAPASWTKLASDLSNASVSDNAYNSWSLNTDGKAAISKTGITKLMTVCQHDADDYFTSSGSWVTRLLVRFSDYTGTSSDPYIEITYTSTTTYNQDVIATATATASIIKGMSKTVSATATATASVLKQMSVSMSAGASVAASIVKQMAKELLANVSSTAQMTATKVYLETLEAIATVTGAITKIPGKLLSSTSTISASVATALNLSRTLQATASVTASVVKGLSKTLEATTSVAGSITKVPGKLLSAVASVTAAIETAQAKVLTATATITATVEASRAVIMTATTTVTADVSKVVGKLLSVTASITAKILAPFWRTKYPAHGDGEDYEIKYPHD